MQLNPPYFLPLRGEFQAYQGTRATTPARMSSAASSATTTAQPSIDNNQLFRAFTDAELVLIGAPLYQALAHGSIARRVTLVRFITPKCVADLPHLLRR